MTVYRTYEEAEADLWEMAEQLSTVIQETRERVKRHHLDTYGWAPGEPFPYLPDPPEPKTDDDMRRLAAD